MKIIILGGNVAKKKIILAVVAVLAIYSTIYLVWSRTRTPWRGGGVGEYIVWSFYDSPPVDVAKAWQWKWYEREWRTYEERETICRLIFRPCIWLDEYLTVRRCDTLHRPRIISIP